MLKLLILGIIVFQILFDGTQNRHHRSLELLVVGAITTVIGLHDAELLLPGLAILAGFYGWLIYDILLK